MPIKSQRWRSREVVENAGYDTLGVMRIFFVLFGCYLAAGASVAGKPVPDKTPRPGVFLITIDTLRADHVHCYGTIASKLRLSISLRWRGFASRKHSHPARSRIPRMQVF